MTPFLLGTVIGGVLGALVGVGAGIVTQRWQAARPGSVALQPVSAPEYPRFETLLQ